MTENKLQVYISYSIDKESHNTGRNTPSVVARLGMTPVHVPHPETDSEYVQWHNSVASAIQASDTFVGSYSITISEYQQEEYRLAKSYNKPRVIFLTHSANKYRDSLAHGDFPSIPFLNELLAANIITPVRGISGYESDLTNTLLSLQTSLPPRTTAPSPNVNMPSNSTKSEFELPADFDQRIYAAAIRAVTDFQQEQQKENNPPQGSLFIQPSFPVPGSLEAQYMCDVFVIMPFAEEFKAVFTDVIQPVWEALQLRAKRGDDFYSNDQIIYEVWYALMNCRLVIADCTGKNANVFYELGIAHTLGKPVIVITQEIDDLPFDIMSRRAIRYSNSLAGPRQLQEQLKAKIPIILNALDTLDPESE